MVRKYFGTDGIRGKANEGAMTAETALRVGMAAGRVFRRKHNSVFSKNSRLNSWERQRSSSANKQNDLLISTEIKRYVSLSVFSHEGIPKPAGIPPLTDTVVSPAGLVSPEGFFRSGTRW